MCSGGESEISQTEEIEGRHMSGVAEGEERMSGDEARDEVEGEGELAPPDWRMTGPRNNVARKEKEEHEATHVPFRD